MSKNSSSRKNDYDRVMPRVYNSTHLGFKTTSSVIRHGIPTPLREGGITSSSNLNSSIYKELPLVLHDYEPETPSNKPKMVKHVKPKKTLKSLDPAKSPITIKNNLPKRPNTAIPLRKSAPSVIPRSSGSRSDAHVKQCFASRPHSRLKEIKNEIQQFEETQKYMQMRCKLYKKCGVVLDDIGQVAEDKAVQVEELNHSSEGVVSVS